MSRAPSAAEQRPHFLATGGIHESVLVQTCNLLLQVPEADRPAYSKGQHLRGVDNDNAERCRAEIVSGAAITGPLLEASNQPSAHLCSLSSFCQRSCHMHRGQ